ncbi:histidine phosphatase family protein [Oryzisolibacter sp. LB2S]|uniref:histidine phosphatase family protein n=1 Tax=Alicycliphilus soli TaxID=3228789 RepID=UPI00345916B6
MSRLWLVRHARPLAADGLCYGRLDLAADAAASRAAARTLAAALPPRVAGLWHSPLQRCELLALDLRALRPDLASIPEPRILEMDFGAWEGLAWDAIAQAEIAAWADDLARHAPGGGEPLSAMLARVDEALGEAAARARAGGGDVVWITHAGVARCVHWLQVHGPARLPRSDEWPVQAPGFGDWVQVEL